MKRKILKIVAIALPLIAMSMLSQAAGNNTLFKKGDRDVNAMIGFANTYSGWGYAATTSIPALSLSFDYGLRDDWGPGVFSIGGFIGGSSEKYSSSALGYSFSWKYSELVVAARATYHYQFIDKLDTYGGAMLGIRHLSSKYTGSSLLDYGSSSTNGLMFPLFVGAKYYFTPKFSVMAELGWEVAWLNLGVGLKL